MNFVRIPKQEIERHGSQGVSSQAKVLAVLFVCKCNVCRSPAAASVFRKYVQKHCGTTPIRIDSAGTSLDSVDLKASFSMRWTSFRRGYRLKRRARRVIRTDLVNFDLVIAMDERVLAALQTIHSKPQASLKLLGDFIPSGSLRNVPDPMNRSNRTCNKVFDMLESASPGILEALLALQKRLW